MTKIPQDATGYRARRYPYITQRGVIKMFIIYLRDEIYLILAINDDDNFILDGVI
jgi:hypothetical protein